MKFMFKGVIAEVASSEKRIVEDVTGECHSGQTLAILGPSGAGKTSLLNLLTLNPTGCNSYGQVTLDGIPLSPSIFREKCCLVEQLDSHRAFLTCKETVRYTIDFYEIDMSEDEKDKACDDLLQRLGLSSCADTKVGNQFIQGLSGGQKKRLSVAVALCKKPKVLFLDEPTSGLDAGSAEGIISFIRDLARGFNIIVILTVHQPSSKIYFDFDQVLLMSQGRTAYCGTPAGSVEHFTSMGQKCPEMANPADFLLSAINQEFAEGGADAVDKILSTWENMSTGDIQKYIKASSVDGEAAADEPGSATAATSTPSKQRLTWVQDFRYVLRRQCKIVLTDPMVYAGRGLGFICICAFFAVIYIEARKREQSQLMNRLFFLMWLMGVPTSMGVVAVYVFNEEFKTIEKEVRNGMYRLSTYLLSAFIIQIPACFFLAVCATGLSGFAMIKLYAPNFFGIVSQYCLLLFAFECIARCASVLFSVPLMGMLGYMNVWFMSFLFSGIMVPEDQIIYPFRILVWLLPLNWGMSAISWLDIADTTYDGAYLCTQESGRTDCLNHFDEKNNKIWPGWTCSETPNGEYNPTQCLGYTGTQALDSIGITFESISSADNIGRNTLYNILIAVSVWLLYVVFAYKRVMRESTIRPLSELPAQKAKPDTKGDFEMVMVNSV